MMNSIEGSKSINSTNSGQRSCNSTDQLKELQLSLTKQHEKNKNKYDSLRRQGVTIGFHLYSPITFPIDKIKPSTFEHTKIQLIASVDRLFKESDILTKIEMKHLNDKHEEAQIQENMEYKINNNYLFLRKTLNIEEAESISTQDRLDKLNKIIGTLKGGAQQMLRQTELTNKSITMKGEEMFSHPLYEKMKQNLQKSTMKLEDERQKFQEQLTHQFQQKQELIKQNNILRKDIQTYKVKVRSLEMEVAEYLNKVNTLTQKLFQNNHKKTVQQSKSVKYFGSDFEIDIKSSKQFKLNFENQLVKRTLEELQEFLEGYHYSVPEKEIQLSTALGSENFDNNSKINLESHSQQKDIARQSSGSKRRCPATTRNLIAPGDPQNITKARFTRTTTLINNNPKLENEALKHGYLRTRTDSYRN